MRPATGWPPWARRTASAPRDSGLKPHRARAMVWIEGRFREGLDTGLFGVRDGPWTSIAGLGGCGSEAASGARAARFGGETPKRKIIIVEAFFNEKISH